MDKEGEGEIDLIEIGAASTETLGKTGPVTDFMLGQTVSGLTDE